eukprot:1161023-Pelagomonas_calceolata.AAC.4
MLLVRHAGGQLPEGLILAVIVLAFWPHTLGTTRHELSLQSCSDELQQKILHARNEHGQGLIIFRKGACLMWGSLSFMGEGSVGVGLR